MTAGASAFCASRVSTTSIHEPRTQVWRAIRSSMPRSSGIRPSSRSSPANCRGSQDFASCSLPCRDPGLRSNSRPRLLRASTPAHWRNRRVRLTSHGDAGSRLRRAPPISFLALRLTGRFEYAGRLFSRAALGRAWRRVQIGLGVRQRSARGRRLGRRHSAPRPSIRLRRVRRSRTLTAHVSEAFPAIEPSRHTYLDRLPQNTFVTLIAPLAFHFLVPRPGSKTGAEDAACKRAIAASSPHERAQLCRRPRRRRKNPRPPRTSTTSITPMRRGAHR